MSARSRQTRVRPMRVGQVTRGSGRSADVERQVHYNDGSGTVEGMNMGTRTSTQLSCAAKKSERGAGSRTAGWRVSILAGLGLFAACAGSETGNAQFDRPERPVSIALAFATGTSVGLSSTSADGWVMTVDEGTAWVESLELGLASGEVCSDDPVLAESLDAFFHPRCEHGDSLFIKGPWVVDLVTGRFEPPLEGLSLPETALSEVRVKLKSSSAAPALEVLGFVGDREFEFALKGSIPAKFKGDEPVLLDEGLGRLLLDLDFAAWFRELEVAPCVAAPGRPSGPVDFASPVCGAIEQGVRNQLVRGDLKGQPR